MACSIQDMSFDKWLRQRFLDWEHSTGERQTDDAWAKHLGFKPATVRSWLNGGRRDLKRENVDKLAGKLGPEVYVELGLMPPGDDVEHLVREFMKLDPDERRELREDADRRLRERKGKGANASSTSAHSLSPV